MRGYMFRNRWGALLFVGLTLAGVTTLVGTERGDGAIQQATHQIAQQKAQAERLTEDPAAVGQAGPGDPATAVGFLPDEELIDPAEGEDPTPIDEFAAAAPEDSEVAAEEEVIIVSRDVAGQTGLQPEQQ